MKNPPAPPMASEVTPLGEAALLEGVEVPELEEEPEVLDPVVVPEELELEEEDGVLAPLFTSNLTPVISLPV